MGAMRGDVSQANQFYLAQGQNNLMNSPSTNQQIKDGQMRPLPSPGGVEARHQSIQNMGMGQAPQDFMQNVSTPTTHELFVSLFCLSRHLTPLI